MMSGRSTAPFKTRHFFSADCISLKTIVKQAMRDPLPLVLRCRNRTVANVLSMGFVVRMCSQCSAGKS